MVEWIAPSISHIPGKLNTEADRASRESHNSNTEWSLDPTIFDELKFKWGDPEIDMFASRLNQRDGTRKQYCTYITAWLKYCSDCNISQVNPKLQQVLDFLTLQSKRVGYSAVATARSALSSFIKVDGVKVGDHPLVSRFMTGLFNQKQALPRYSETWDPQIVLNHLKTFPAIDDMSLKQLTLKLVMVMALLSAQRVQTLQSLSLEEMSTLPGKYVFRISSVLKQTTAKRARTDIYYPLLFIVTPWTRDCVSWSYFQLMLKEQLLSRKRQSSCLFAMLSLMDQLKGTQYHVG